MTSVAFSTFFGLTIAGVLRVPVLLPRLGRILRSAVSVTVSSSVVREPSRYIFFASDRHEEFWPKERFSG